MKYDRFSRQDWQRIQQDWTAWWDGSLQRPLVLVTTQDPGHPPGDFHNNLVRFPVMTPPQAILDYYQPYLETTHYFGDAFPQWWLNAGPGIVAAFLGSRPSFAGEGDWGTTWFESLGVSSLQEIELRYNPDNLWWRHCLTLTRAAVERWGDHVVIGHTDLGGNLDILASLRGSMELLYDVTDAPDEVERLTRQITPLWLRYYDELYNVVKTAPLGASYWSTYWSPGTGYILQSDFSYMISHEMFQRFVLPDLTACCAHLEYPFYHLDGKGQLIHLDAILAIPNLRGVQWQPGDGAPLADQWLDVLARIRAAGKLCQVYVKREGARRIARELGGQGFQFQIVNEDLTPHEAEAFVEEMQQI
ncbi:MAG: hypothetical protein IPK19_38585 [Chloroflexi bacterium]|nr:hypothetical protein [Chloroflexota bacterium]